MRGCLPLQEEHTLCSLSGGAVTPESQLEESTSPADTTEDDLLPLKPWGRSQSLPAYADLIMVGTSVEARRRSGEKVEILSREQDYGDRDRKKERKTCLSWCVIVSLPCVQRVGGPSFCNNLANTREEMDDSGSSSTKVPHHYISPSTLSKNNNSCLHPSIHYQ